MTINILKGKGAGAPSKDVAAEIAEVGATIDQIVADDQRLDREIAAADREYIELRYGKGVLKENIDGQLARLNTRLGEMRVLKLKGEEELVEQRRYLVILESPHLEAREAELREEYRIIMAQEPAHLINELEVLQALMMVRGQRRKWHLGARRACSAVNSRRRRLGLPALNRPRDLSYGRKLHPLASLLAGRETSPAAYEGQAARLRAVLKATASEIKKAWKTPGNDRTPFQSDLVSTFSLPEEKG